MGIAQTVEHCSGIPSYKGYEFDPRFPYSLYERNLFFYFLDMQKGNKGNIVAVAIAFGFFVALFFILFFAFSVKVPVGYTAIKVDVYGKNVEPQGLKTGRNFVNTITHDVYKYPIFIQQMEYQDVRFQDKGGLVVVADIGMDYKFDETKIGTIYSEYRAWVDKITSNYMRTWVTNAVNRASSDFDVDALYGESKEEFRLAVLKNLQDDLSKKGIVVNNIYFTDDMELPQQVKDRINSKIEATQKAMQAENELRTTKAEAQKVIEAARGDAEAILLKAKAEADANKLIDQSITPTLIEYEKSKKWNGALPQVTGGATPFISIK